MLEILILPETIFEDQAIFSHRKVRNDCYRFNIIFSFKSFNVFVFYTSHFRNGPRVNFYPVIDHADDSA